jgi:Ca2+-binding EF-hand superfamily protein
LPFQCSIVKSKFISFFKLYLLNVCFSYNRKGYISTSDLKEVFEILGESITDDEVNTMIKIAGIKSNDKINFKEFVDFFYKID